MFFFRSEENIRQGQDKKDKESWRKTLEEKYDKLSDKCDKLAEDNQQIKVLLKKSAEDNQEMKLLLKKSTDHNQEMKVFLEKLLSQTINIPKVESTSA